MSAKNVVLKDVSCVRDGHGWVATTTSAQHKHFTRQQNNLARVVESARRECSLMRPRIRISAVDRHFQDQQEVAHVAHQNRAQNDHQLQTHTQTSRGSDTPHGALSHLGAGQEELSEHALVAGTQGRR